MPELSKHTRLRKALRVALRFGAIVLVLYLIAWGLATARLRAVWAEATRLGQENKPEALIPPPIADSQNGMIELQEAWKHFDEGGPEDAVDAYFDYEETDAHRAILLAYLTEPQTQEMIQLIERGASKQAFRYPIKYRDGPHALLPHLSKIRALSRLLCIEAVRQAEADDCDRAWQLIEAGLFLVDAPKDEPILSSQLVRYAVAAIVCKTMEDISHFGVPDDARLQRITNQLDALSGSVPIFRAFQGDRVFVMRWLFENASVQLGLEDSIGAEAGNLLIHPWVIASQAEMELYLLGESSPYEPSREPPGKIWFIHDQAPKLSKMWVKHRYFEQMLQIAKVGLTIQSEFQRNETYPAEDEMAERLGSWEPDTHYIPGVALYSDDWIHSNSGPGSARFCFYLQQPSDSIRRLLPKQRN